jgi:class 3 adenylate cyclase
VEVPPTCYAETDRGAIAYQVVGDGPIDVLVNRQIDAPIDLMWDEPRHASFLNRLSSFSRHIWFDPRGTGASDWIPHSEGRLLESVVDDTVAVLNAVGCDRAALLSLTVTTGLLFAATHPERTTGVVVVNGTARYRHAVDYPQGLPEAELDRALDLRRAAGWALERSNPSLAGDTRYRQWYERAQRLMAPPDYRLWRERSTLDIDLRHVLASVRAPTLIINRRDRRTADQTRFLAEQITSAKYVELPGADYLAFAGDATPVLDAIEEFLTGQLAPPRTDRVLATVLFTDLVGSTVRAAELGDRRWRELLTTHDGVIAQELDRFRGRQIKSTGDGVLATFDGPGRAIRCACAIREAVQALNINVRAGLHTGEIELRGDDVAGIAVHLAQRVSALAHPGEVLVSRTVTDLVAGSGIRFEDRGEHELKGIPGTWHLYSVVA